MVLTAVGGDVQEGTDKKEKPILGSKNFIKRFNKKVKKVVEGGVASIDFLLNFPGGGTKEIIEHLKEKGFIEEGEYLFLKNVDYYDYYENYKPYIDKLIAILNSKVDELGDNIFSFTEDSIITHTLFKVLETNVEMYGNSIDYSISNFDEFDRFIEFYSEKNNISQKEVFSNFFWNIRQVLANINYKKKQKLDPYNRQLFMDWGNGKLYVDFTELQQRYN